MYKLRISSLIYLAALLAMAPARAAYFPVTDATGNSAMTSALNLSALFTTTPDMYATNVHDPQTLYSHASVQAVTNVSGQHDWYSFAVINPNTKAFFDIDFSHGDLWSYIKLYDSHGNKVADGFNGVGETFDPGSQYPWDSFLMLTLASAGNYYLSVGRDNDQGLLAGQGYSLHVGVEADSVGTVSTPLPGGIWLFGGAFIALFRTFQPKKRLVLKREFSA